VFVDGKRFYGGGVVVRETGNDRYGAAIEGDAERPKFGRGTNRGVKREERTIDRVPERSASEGENVSRRERSTKTRRQGVRDRRCVRWNSYVSRNRLTSNTTIRFTEDERN
jgi:hypothetical protein